MDKSVSAEALTNFMVLLRGRGQWRLEKGRDEAKEMKRNDEG